MLTGRHYSLGTLGKFWDIPQGDSPIFIPPTPGNTQVYIPPKTTIPPNSPPPVSPSPDVPTPTTGAGTTAVETMTSGGTPTGAVERVKATLTSKPVLIGGGLALAVGAFFAASRLLR